MIEAAQAMSPVINLFTSLIAALEDPLAIGAAIVLVGYLIAQIIFIDRPAWKFVCQFTAFAGFTAVLVHRGLLPTEATRPSGATFEFLIFSIFKIAWWIGASYLLANFFRAALIFKRKPVETRFLQDLVAGLAHIGAILAIIAFVFDLPISGLVAASGVVAILLGLALQSTLGDVFSGLALNLSKPYGPGDWVIIDGGVEGRVIEVNWRATHITNSNGDLVIVPNSVVAKGKLVNADLPSRAHGVSLTVRLDPDVAPSHACAVLENAFLSCNRILAKPAPWIAIRSLDAMALECELRAFVPNLDDVDNARNELFDHVFRHCLSAGIRLAPPAASSILLPPRAVGRLTEDVPHFLVERLPIFAPLSDEERQALAPKMKRRFVKPGDILLQQGTVAPALWIVESGVIQSKRDRELYRLAPGECFGQSGLLTGTPSRFTVSALTDGSVLEIQKGELAPILKKRPSIAEELGKILTRREALGHELLEEPDPSGQGVNLAERLAARVRSLFGLG